MFNISFQSSDYLSSTKHNPCRKHYSTITRHDYQNTIRKNHNRPSMLTITTI